MKKLLMMLLLLIATTSFASDNSFVAERQEEIRGLVEKMKVLASKPVNEKYRVICEGYEIERIGAEQVDVILNIRIMENQFYHKDYNEILKNLSEPIKSQNTWLLGGNYRLESGRLVNSRYYIPKDAKTPNTVDSVKAQIYINDSPVDKCREYRDNLLVVYDPIAFVNVFKNNFVSAFKQAYNGEKVETKHITNSGIVKSKVIPEEGLPLKVKYQITNLENIKLEDLKVTINECPTN